MLFLMWWIRDSGVFQLTAVGFGLAVVAVFVDPWIRDQFRRPTASPSPTSDPPKSRVRPAPVATPRRDPRPVVPARQRDLMVLGGFVALCVTVLVPWLIGRFLLRDSAILDPNPGVFDTSVRSGGAYFLSDYLSGVLVIGVLTVAFLLLRPWVRRTGSVAAGLFLAGLMLVALVGARGLWTTQEAASAEELRNGTFPFHDRVAATCFGDQTFAASIGGQSLSVGVHQTDNGEMFIAACNRVNVYHGWTLAGQVDLEPATASIETPFLTGDDAAGDAWFSALVSTSPEAGAPRYVTGLSLLHPESPWRLDLAAVGVPTDPSYQPTVFGLGSVIAVDDQLDYYNHRLLGVDMRSGQVLWTLGCPGGYSSSSFVRIDTDPAATMRMWCGRGGVGPTDEFLFDAGGIPTPLS